MIRQSKRAFSDWTFFDWIILGLLLLWGMRPDPLGRNIFAIIGSRCHKQSYELNFAGLTLGYAFFRMVSFTAVSSHHGNARQLLDEN